MDGDVAVFAQVMTVIVATVASFILIGFGTRALWRLGSRPSTPRAMTSADEGRLQRLEIAVEAIAVEVERISEAQRFTVSLLSERFPGRDRPAELAPPGGAKRTNTPH
jgi:hypothetical protein